jgi:hypothetical protein
LSPYSPDFNPIELSFATLKAWMRKNCALARQFETEFEGFLHLAVMYHGVEDHAKDYFRHCGIRVDSTTIDISYNEVGSESAEAEVEEN